MDAVTQLLASLFQRRYPKLNFDTQNMRRALTAVALAEVQDQPKALLVSVRHRQHPGHVNPVQVIAWVHNTMLLAASAILAEGMVRSSSWNPKDASWLPPCGFFCRAHPATNLGEAAVALALIQSLQKAWVV